MKITALNGQYNAEFSEWWKLKDAMAGRLKKTKGCKCKVPQPLLLQRLRGGPPPPDMYDTARKVEECENKVIKVSDDIARAQARGRKATIDAIENRRAIGRSRADQEHLNKLLNQKPHLDNLSNTKLRLEKIEKSRQEKVDEYKVTNSDIRKQLEELDSELKKCGCST